MKLHTYKLLDVASIIIIVMVVFIMSLIGYMKFAPVDVIRNDTWVLCTHPIKHSQAKATCEQKQETFKAGETLTIYINSDKVRNVGGYFTNTVECKDNGVFKSYPVFEQHVNRAVGHVEAAIDTKLPVRVTHLPATCRVAYVLEYSIYSFRSFSEYNYSNEFTLTE